MLLPPSIASVLLPFTAVLHLLPVTHQVRMNHTATAAAAVARLTPAKRVAGIAVERVPPSGRNDNLAKRVNSAAAASVHATAAAGHRFMYGPQNLLRSDTSSLAFYSTTTVTVTPAATAEAACSGSLTVNAPLADTVNAP